MLFAKSGSQIKHLTFPADKRRSFWIRHLDKLLFLLFVSVFYLFVLVYIRPVDGINDDWGMYSTLSGAYLGYPDAHVLFFLYPLSWILSKLYTLNSSIPWYGLFLHGIHILCIYLVYRRALLLWKKHTGSEAVFWPALSLLCVLFLIVDLNVICEIQYTTTAGFCAASALFLFLTSKSDEGSAAFLRGNIPTLLLAWLTFCMRQNVLFMMIPIAGMLWLSKWVLSNHRFYSDYFLKLLVFAGILCLGMGILYGMHRIAYSGEEWSDFIRINHYRERVGDFYTWPEYEECAAKLKKLGISEETYLRRKYGAPYIGHQMSLEDWEQMHQIAKECYQARTSLKERFKNILTGSLTVFLFQNGMQPLNLCVAFLFLVTLLAIVTRRNLVALAVYLLFLAGRTVTWGYILFEGRFPKRIIQPLIAADFMVLFGILFAFNLIRLNNRKKTWAILFPCVMLLASVSVYATKTDVDVSYHANEAVWKDLKAYCFSHPENFYIWTYNGNTLDNYCESPFDTTADTYQNFFYTNWGVVCNPNSRIKLAGHGIGEFGEDLVNNKNVYFIFEEGLYHREHPVIMYFRHTYDVDCGLTDTFPAGGHTYEVYQLQ